jgi:TatD-related deoxyribonuclease
LIPVADSHAHVNPVRGLGAGEVARRFRNAGGWFIALASLQPSAYGVEGSNVEAYVQAALIHARECGRAREEGLRVYCLAGFHPAEVDKLIDRNGLKPLEVLELGFKVLEELSKLVDRGEIDGIGEVGRQHYRTASERVLVANMILEKAIEIARDKDIVVHMHLEQAGEATVELVDVITRRLNAKKEKLVFHHAEPRVAVEATRRGYQATIPGIPKLLEHVLENLEPTYTLESDYLDDPKRPGAVTTPWDMANNIARIATKSKDIEEKVYRINVDNIAKTYSVRPP